MKITKMVRAGLFGLPLLALAASVLFAGPLPDATYAFYCQAYPNNAVIVSGTLTGPGFTATDSDNSGYGATFASVTGGSDPFLLVQSTGSGGNTNKASAQLTYYFEVTSSGSANVPLDFAGVFSEQLGLPPATSSAANADIIIAGPGGIHQATVFSASNGNWDAYTNNAFLGNGTTTAGTTTGNDTISFDQKFYIAPNEVYSIQLGVLAQSQYGAAYSPNNAELDPTITIDPAFLALNPGDAIDFSPGFIPEPADYAVWVGAAALVVVAGLRLRRKPAA